MLHIICMIMQRMGLENCDANMWAVTLKETVSSKIEIKGNNLNVMQMEENERNELMSQFNCFIMRKVKRLARKMDNSKSILSTNIAFFLQEIDKTHINKVKEMLVMALNHETQQHL